MIVHQADLQRGWDGLPAEDAAIAATLLPTVLPSELGDIAVIVVPGNRPALVQAGDGTRALEGDPRMLLAWASGRAASGGPVDANAPDSRLPSISKRTWF